MFELLRVLGEGLILEPLASSLIGAQLLSLSSENALAAKSLAEVISGESRVISALAESKNGFSNDEILTSAADCSDGFKLNGEKNLILDADSASNFIVSANYQNKNKEFSHVALYLVDRKSEGISISSSDSTDDRQLINLKFDDVILPREALILENESANDAIEFEENLRAACASADALGAMHSLLSRTVEYSKDRKQFGKAIGSFQALQHKMADMFMAVERAKSMFTMMCEAFSSSMDLTRMVSMARVEICDSARLVGQHAVQIHGGIGITDELAAAHYFKRLTASQYYGGDSMYHLGKYLSLRNSVSN
jgi:alkylation response protein AidB-like acyl-CoA dehydrogenase